MFPQTLGNLKMSQACGKLTLEKLRTKRKLQDTGLHRMRSIGVMCITMDMAVLNVGVLTGMVRRAIVVTTITECLVLNLLVPN